MPLKALTCALFAAVILASAGAIADDKRIAQCIEDNKDEGQEADVVKKYCTCMDGKMTPGESQSISAWEEGHDAEDDACSEEADWKDD